MCASLFISGWLADTWWTAACVVDRHQFDPPFAERRPGRVSAATPAPKYRGVERERGSRGSRRAEHHERQLGHAQASCFLWLLLIPKTMPSGGWDRRVHREKPVLVSNGTREASHRLSNPRAARGVRREAPARTRRAPATRPAHAALVACQRGRPGRADHRRALAGRAAAERDEERAGARLATA